MLPRVFLVAGHPQTDAARVRAAALWVGTSGAVSGPAAAWWHGMLAGATRDHRAHSGPRTLPAPTTAASAYDGER